MKKYILLFFIFCIQLFPAKAQWVTIPDPNFATRLQQLFPSCMNGNQMDTTCAGILNATSLDVSLTFAISDINGVQYFDNLLTLDCSDNFLSSLPTLPNSLTILNCYGNQLNSLPTLPNSLLELYCFENLLSSLPVLPNSLTSIDCYDNQLTSLPTLPSSLIVLICYSNQLSSIPILPDSLNVLQCSYNQLSSLPALPNSLTVLNCGYNQLSGLPALPDSLTGLLCSNNQLSSLPALPNSLTVFNCSYNQLNSLPSVPNLMQSFIVNNNNISCLVNLPEVINGVLIFNNPFTCVPNQTAYSLGLPLCIDADPVNNPNNCPGVNITGSIYTDLNGNCSYNSIDLNSQNIPIKLYDYQNNFLAQSYTINGVYSFANLLPDTFQVKIDTTNFPILMSCGQSSLQSVILTTANQTMQNINFPVLCNAGYDVYVQSVNPQGWVFPGQVHEISTNITDNETWFNIDCNEGNTSGMVTLNVNGPVSFGATTLGALTPTVNGNTYTYSVSDFNTLNPNSFGLQLITDTTAQANDQICVHVEITPTPLDADTINNVYDFCYNVVNSYDPNMKEVYPVNVLPGYDDWFTYTIHFQNTGNAPAFNIRLRDTLDANLDINTFEIRGYSHPAVVSINGNNLTVRFNNIMLPDSTSDYEGSMGYFQYRIKPLPNLPLGSQIENTAYIYFDYNAPIVTNTTQNNFQTVVSTFNAKDDTNQLKVFPNPANEILNINLQNNNIENCIITNALGQMVYSSANEINGNHKIQLNISNLSAGFYFVKVSAGDDSYNAKFIKSE